MLNFSDGSIQNMSTYRKVALIHAASINQGFLSNLGERFLSFLYEVIDTSSNSILFAEYQDGNVVGFVAGGRDMHSIYRQMLKNWPRLICTLFPALLNPINLKRIFEIIFFIHKQKPTKNFPTAELFSIAVLEDFRGQGIAEKLYRSLAEWFAQQGESAFCIVVGNNLMPAHSFYRKMGAKPMFEVIVHQGQSSTLYRHDLSKPINDL